MGHDEEGGGVVNIIDAVAALVAWPLVALFGASDPGKPTQLSFTHCQDAPCTRWANEGTGRCKEHWKAFVERVSTSHVSATENPLLQDERGNK